MAKRRFPKATKKAARRAQRRPQTRRTRKRVPRKRPPERTGSKQASAKRPKRRVLAAVAKMRKGKSLSRAARSAHTTRKTVRKYRPFAERALGLDLIQRVVSGYSTTFNRAKHSGFPGNA
jgi:hypothetical protein